MDHPFFEELLSFTHLLSKHHYCLPFEIYEKGTRFISTSTKSFRESYSKFHLAKILNIFCHFEKKITEKQYSLPQKKEVYFRLLKTNDSSNSSLGIAVVLKVDSYNEFLSTEHLLQAILHIIPGVLATHSKTYYYRDEQAGIVFIFQEIEKKRGRGFTKLDRLQLTANLRKELEESIETYSPSLYLIHNQEEAFRNVVQMGRELQSKDDLPQVMISFQEQTQKGILRFSVVVLRLVQNNSPTLKELAKCLPQTVEFIPELVTQVGMLDPTHAKEANLLILEVEERLFSRKNSSINLREARAYIAKALELVVGEFRDYNGGLLLRQNQQLSDIKRLLGDNEIQFLESIFYSITPSVFQTFILPQAIQICSLLYCEAKASLSMLSQTTYSLFKKHEKDFSIILIQTRDIDLHHTAIKQAANLTVPLHQFGYAAQKIQNEYYLWLIYQYPLDQNCFDEFEKLLERFHLVSKSEKRALRINFQDGDPLSLNPQIGLDLRCRSIQKALFEGLTRIGANGKVELAAAEKVEIFDEGKTYLFTLRKLQWSNGEELTAYQFEKSWKSAIASPSCLRPDVFFIIQNARHASNQQINASEIGVSALDKNTLKVTLEYPADYFLQLLAHPLFFALHEDHGEPYLFSGPFTLHSWHRNHSLTLIKNPYYWDVENVKLDSVHISIIRDPQCAFQKYKNRELDWIGGPFSLLSRALLAQVEGQTKKVNTSGVGWIYCNLSHPLLQSVNIRKGLSYALNRDKICNKMARGHPLNTFLPNQLSQLDEYQAYDVKKAIEHFELGLKEKKFCLGHQPPFSLFHSHIPGQKELAQEIQAQWNEVLGLKISVVEKSWNTFSHKLDNRLFHFGSCYRHPYYNDARYFFDMFYEPTNIHNAFGWHNDQFNEAINCARKSADYSPYLKKAEEELLNEMPVIPIHAVSYHYLADEKLKGIHFCHSGDVDLKWIYFAEE